MPETSFSSFAPPVADQTELRRAITAAYRRPEAEALAPLLTAATLPADMRQAVRATGRQLITALRTKRRRNAMEALVQEYSLSSEEGVALMCLAEALLRIPDNATRDALIRDKIAGGAWQDHAGAGRSLFVNAATWGLVVTGRLVTPGDESGLSAALTRLLARAGAPVIRRGVALAMRMMGEQFVTGETIEQALKRSRKLADRGFTYSYDMLGEAAASASDAARYLADYETAIHAIGAVSRGRGLHAEPGISIKLSALHPRFSRAQASRVMRELLPRLKSLAMSAKAQAIGLSVDAEEADRLDLTLDLFEALALDPELQGWDGLGIVVQAYGKRCAPVIDWIIDLARRAGRRIMVRLVKGAYWDAEIKRAQVDGLLDFPVFTRKAHTDISYIACARKLLDAGDLVFPQFATHNAQTVATIYHLAGPNFTPGRYEFQCLHGMGEALYEEVVGPHRLDRPCRIYAPVGSHETLLAYLVRRLLENGANSSFVNRIADPAVALDALLTDPVETVRAMPKPGAAHAAIARPADLYGSRRNSVGIDLSDEATLAALAAALTDSARRVWTAGDGKAARDLHNPADHRDLVGRVRDMTEGEARDAVDRAARSNWAAIPVAARAAKLERAADALEKRMPVLLGLIVREAGKSVPNAIAEVREAIDFLRYYAEQARLAGDHVPLGPVVCISPWNFPLAIFTGQIAAALVTGNSVLAKPAEQTPLIAAEAVRLLHEAGVPHDALQLVPGDGLIGAVLVAAPDVAGVMFTGSTEVARLIQKQLAERLSPEGRPIPLIAETGGQNAMIVDSSALAEQVVRDVIASAFDSAGQRCSALRILCLQDEVADRILDMLRGAMRELNIGNPDRLSVDIGPVIDAEAKANIERHVEAMRAKGFRVEQLDLSDETRYGTFAAPTIIELDGIADLERELFGPVLHVIRYRRERLDALVDAINATGYGLTFGLHTRLEATVQQVIALVRAGNVYVNRNMVGAVVGVQPFGGNGLSGTGPKAGGPLYLGRLVQSAAVDIRSAASINPALIDFVAWLERHGEPGAGTLALRQAGSIPPTGPVELPGPAGERNLYMLRPRGRILICPVTQVGLFRQIAAVLAAGCNGVIQGWALPEDLPGSVAARLSTDANGGYNGALIEGEPARIVAVQRQLVAISEGIIIAQAPTEQDYRLDWLFEEVSISIDTTAAGGNASLMMLCDTPVNDPVAAPKISTSAPVGSRAVAAALLYASPVDYGSPRMSASDLRQSKASPSP